jgi:hypothetical protein
MKSMTRLVSIFAFVAAAAGCGVHLGDNYGRRTRAAFDAQAAGRGQGSMAIDGEDAKTVMTRHHIKPGTQQGAGGQQGLGMPMGAFVGGSSSQGSPVTTTNTGKSPISLDAVR